MPRNDGITLSELAQPSVTTTSESDNLDVTRPTDDELQETAGSAELLVEASVAQVEAHEAARRLFRRAVKVNKNHSPSWVAWAKFEQRQGNIGKLFFKFYGKLSS